MTIVGVESGEAAVDVASPSKGHHLEQDEIRNLERSLLGAALIVHGDDVVPVPVKGSAPVSHRLQQAFHQQRLKKAQPLV